MVTEDAYLGLDPVDGIELEEVVLEVGDAVGVVGIGLEVFY